MRKDMVYFSKSAFLGMQKDAAVIMNKILANPDVLKLLYYGVRDWKNRPDVTSAQVKEMFTSKQVSCVPQVKCEDKEKTYLRLTYGSTVPNSTNPQYRDNTFNIDIICHYDTWDLGDFDLRPYRIAGEIDSMLDEAKLSGIGELHFVSCTPAIYDAEFAGVSLTYVAVRGNEDKVNPLE